MSSIFDTRMTRRTAMKNGVAAGVALGMTPWAVWAAQTAALPQITKTIPSSGEKLPVIGLGTNQYSVTDPAEIAARREVLKHFPELGAKVIDTARGYGEAEVGISNLLKELGSRDKIFLATKTQIRGQVLPGDGELEASLKRLQTNKLDLFQIRNFNGIDELFPKLQEWKKAGKVRYIGITTSTDNQYPDMKAALNKWPMDFIQVDYSIDNRGAADEILPLAQDKGAAVLINVPLGGRRGSVLSKVSNKPVPEWATAELDVTSWAQLFLKYNISHPAVTAVIPGTTKLAHLEDNQRAGRGRLPTAAQRKKIEELWASV